MRRTKIIATLGPATDTAGVIEGLIKAGADVFRLNAAHSGPAELASRLADVRSASRAAGREVAVLLDLPGPKLRVGEVAPGAVLAEGRPFRLVADECVGDEARAFVSHRGLHEDVAPGDRILIDDGRIELVVRSAQPDEVRTEVVTGGVLQSRKGVNVPGVTLSVESITRLDKTLLAWAQANEVDWIGQSFVRSPDDVYALKNLMTVRQIPVVAKIEKHEAAGRIETIIGAADAVMVARGDLAVETSAETVPVLQRRIVNAARLAGKPVIIATEMLDSMRERPRPTRAEASDVANAIFVRADAVMLSGETAVGHHPVEAVGTMHRIASTAEEVGVSAGDAVAGSTDVQVAVSAAASELAEELGLAAIVTITQSGATALAVSRHRPDIPLVAAVPSAGVARKLALVWGVRTHIVAFADETGALLDTVTASLLQAGIVKTGDRIALTAGMGSRTPGGTDLIHVRSA